MHHPRPSLQPLSGAQTATILARARSLASDHDPRAVGLPLRGRRIGMLCRIDTSSARLLRDAAEALGAEVAAVGPMWDAVDGDEDLRHTASIVGRFYDAVDCEGMPAAWHDAFARACNALVFEGLASGEHPIAGLADLLSDAIPLTVRRRLVVQGALLAMLD